MVQQSERLQRLIDRLLELRQAGAAPARRGRAPWRCTTAPPPPSPTRRAAPGNAGGVGAHRPGHQRPWEAELITLAIGNLLDNALTLHPQAARCGWSWTGPRWPCRTAGPGVPDYALPRLGKASSPPRGPGGERSGSGLGLAIVQRVMVLHGGQMQVRNTRAGLARHAGPGR